nr:MAG TPA: hypothetical protein [Caudoviricetes sp.]
MKVGDLTLVLRNPRLFMANLQRLNPRRCRLWS